MNKSIAAKVGVKRPGLHSDAEASEREHLAHSLKMDKLPKNTLCPICGGRKDYGTTTFSADLGTGVVVVRKVKARICVQCGEEWIDDKTAQKLVAAGPLPAAANGSSSIPPDSRMATMGRATAMQFARCSGEMF